MKGERVFDEEQEAIKELMEIKHPPAGVAAAIATLADIDRTLAKIAIDEAAASVRPNAKELEKARDALARGDRALARGAYDKAVERYGDAWAHAEKAMKRRPDMSHDHCPHSDFD